MLYDMPFMSVTGPLTHGEAEAAALDEDEVVVWPADETELLVVCMLDDVDEELPVLEEAVVVVVVTTLPPPGIKLPGT